MPSGPKKRKAAKKRSAASIPPRGNGRESDGELRRMEDERAGAEAAAADPDAKEEDKHEGETSDSSDTSASSEDAPSVPEVEELAPEQVEVPVGQAEDSAAESGDLGPLPQAAEVPLEEAAAPQDIAEPPLEEPIPVEGGTVPVETVDDLSLTEPAPGGDEEKGSSGSVAPTEEPPESFAPREEPLEQEHHVQDREIRSEEQSAAAPRVSQRTSWLRCCGLLDAFFGGSNR